MTDPTQPSPGTPPPQQPPQYAQAPYPQGQPYARPPRDSAQTLAMVATAVIIAGLATAACGLIAAIAFLAVDGPSGALKFHQFMASLATGLGLGAIAVAAGFALKMRAERPGSY